MTSKKAWCVWSPTNQWKVWR